MRRINLLLGFLLCCCLSTFAQRVAVKTNVLLDGLLTPNIGFELTTGNKTSLNVNMLSFHHALHQDIDAVGIQPELRYWYSSVPMSRGYVGVIGLAGFYKGDWGKTNYDGYGGGAGISFGYVLNMTKRFNLELSTGMGAVYYHQRVDYNETAQKGYALLPLQAAVSISYVIQ